MQVMLKLQEPETAVFRFWYLDLACASGIQPKRSEGFLEPRHAIKRDPHAEAEDAS